MWLKPQILDLIYERIAQKIKEPFAHVPDVRLKRVELNRAETRVHNFHDFLASERATPLGEVLAQAEEQVKALRADVARLESAKDDLFAPPPPVALPIGSRKERTAQRADRSLGARATPPDRSLHPVAGKHGSG